MDMRVQVNSDGNRTETMIDTVMDMGAIMGAMMSGMEMQIGFFTATEGGEAVESRLYMGGADISDMFGGLDLDLFGEMGGLATDSIISDLFTFLPEFTAAELDDFDIRYDRFNGNWRLWFSGISVPLNNPMIEDVMQGLGITTDGTANVLLSFDIYENNPPHSVGVEIYWQDADVEYFMTFAIGFN
jgi:hypothetical protein